MPDLTEDRLKRTLNDFAEAEARRLLHNGAEDYEFVLIIRYRRTLNGVWFADYNERRVMLNVKEEKVWPWPHYINEVVGEISFPICRRTFTEHYSNMEARSLELNLDAATDTKFSVTEKSNQSL